MSVAVLHISQQGHPGGGGTITPSPFLFIDIIINAAEVQWSDS